MTGVAVTKIRESLLTLTVTTTMWFIGRQGAPAFAASTTIAVMRIGVTWAWEKWKATMDVAREKGGGLEPKS